MKERQEIMKQIDVNSQTTVTFASKSLSIFHSIYIQDESDNYAYIYFIGHLRSLSLYKELSKISSK